MDRYAGTCVAAEAPPGWHLVANDNCGVDDRQPQHVTGTNYRYPEDRIGLDVAGAEDPARTMVYDQNIRFHYSGLDPEEDYQFRLIFLSDNDTRTIRVKADGEVLVDQVKLGFAELITRLVKLPAQTYADSKVTLEFTQVSGSGSDAIISAIELFSTSAKLITSLDVIVDVHDGKISGQVTVDGEPVSGVKVALAIDGSSWERTKTSNRSGQFTASLPSDRAKVTGRKLVVSASKGRAKGEQTLTLLDSLPVSADFVHGPQRPSAAPNLPSLNIGRSYFLADEGYPIGHNRTGGPYFHAADEESFGIENGPGSYLYKISIGDTSCVFFIRASDRPHYSIELQGSGGGYAYPVLIPDLGVGGQFRLAVTANGKTKWLEEFDSNYTSLRAGEVMWTCKDDQLGVEIEMKVNPFIETYGCAATAKVIKGDSVELNWSYEWTGNIKIKDDCAMVTHPDLKYTQVYVGTESRSTKIAKEGGRVRVVERLDKGDKSRFVCVWGYTDYNRREVTNAFDRLKYKPFVDDTWTAQMKDKWFDNWIGKCFEPEIKFIEARDSVDRHLADSEKFWAGHRNRMKIKTSDPQFDTVVNNVSANLFLLYQYPAFLHGMGWNKIGKINCGYYGLEQAGLHEEVGTSLQFLTGNQCLKGRMRYWSPVFMISGWSEEQDFYFVDQVWHHYRWTGDKAYVKTMWPAVRRAMEHGLAACDPDGDGIMTAYYEHWGCDAHTRGGKAVMFNALATSALRGAVEMARIAGDYDTQTGYQGAANEDTPETRLSKFLDRIEGHKDKPFWIKGTGAWGSAENNGDIRPHPEPMEQNYCIWRGWGTDEPMKQYMAMRYIRETLHLTPAAGMTMELTNDYWPIIWDHHDVFNGDSSMSILCAAKTGDIDNYWPSFKSISESAYTNDDATVSMTLRADGLSTDIGPTLELQPQFIQAVVSGLFGAEPFFGDNLLEISPSFPSHWDHAEIATTDFTYAYKRDENGLSVQLTTPVDRVVRARLPVKGKVEDVTLNGQPVDYTIDTAVNVSRVVVETQAGREFAFDVRTAPEAVVTGNELVFAGAEAEFTVSHAKVVDVHDPQEKMSRVSVNAAAKSVSLVPAAVGKYTVFLELQAGKAKWLHALDLDIRKRWELKEGFITTFNPGGPSVASPRVDAKTRMLSLEMINNSPTLIKDKAVVTVAGKRFKEQIEIDPGMVETIDISLAKVWNRLSPGSIPVAVQLAGETQSKNAVNWELGQDKSSTLASRSKCLDLDAYYNIDISHLYSLAFEWRIDYTGCGIGIDWRTEMPPFDKKGFVLTSPPVAVYAYLNLPEAFSLDWRAWEVPDFDRTLGETATGIVFRTGEKPVPNGTRGNILALLSNEPYEQLPSQATIQLDAPLRLEKIYLLTANITKSVKSYYPGAEVVIHYKDDSVQNELLIPPYTMGNILYPVAPMLYHIEFGGSLSMAIGNPSKTGLSVQDIVVDPRKKVESIELICTTSETIFGIMGITLLQVDGK
jgi:hypothetical protein